MKTLSDQILSTAYDALPVESVKSFIEQLKELDIDLTESDKKQIDKLAGDKLI